MQIKNVEILDELARVKKVRADGKLFVQSIQGGCLHAEVGEAEGAWNSIDESYWGSIRVCLRCGLAERQEKAYSPWKILKNELVYKLNDSQVRELTVNADWI